MSIALVRDLWDYHHWANRRLLDVTTALGDEVARRPIGTQFSAPSLTEMFVHLYGADRFWLRYWKGEPPGPRGPAYGLTVASLAELRPMWDALVSEQRGFVGSLTDAGLERAIEVTTADGYTAKRALGMMLLHVPNHATHHRSEIATMITMTSGSPPDTGFPSFYRERDGRAAVERA